MLFYVINIYNFSLLAIAGAIKCFTYKHNNICYCRFAFFIPTLMLVSYAEAFYLVMLFSKQILLAGKQKM